MIDLFHIDNYKINLSKFDHQLHGSVVREFEQEFLDYVGAKYACSVSSATNGIFLCMLGKDVTVKIPSLIPPVVANAIITSGNKVEFIDNTEWVGDCYILHEFDDYKIIDSAQKVEKNQFIKEAKNDDLMIFSFYPTKPVGSIDGGIIVSNDKSKIDYLRMLSFNGMTNEVENWNRKIITPGFKFYMSSSQAFVAKKNLKILDYKKKKLQYIKERYNNEFGLANTSDHLYTILVEDRQRVRSILEGCYINTGIHYTPLHLNPVYNSTKVDLKNSEYVGSRTLSIPFHYKISKQEVEYIIYNVQRFFRSS